MAIVDDVRTKQIVVCTTHGEFYVNKQFTMERWEPFREQLIRIMDLEDNRAFVVNIDHLVWIGPR